MQSITVVSTAEEALSKDRNYLAIDTETPEIEESLPVPPLAFLQAHVDSQLYMLNYWNAGPFWREILRYALKTNRVITSHHTCFDTSVLLLNDPSCADELIECYDRGLIEDTLLTDKLDDIARGQYDNDAKGRWAHSKTLGKRTLFYYGLSDCCEIRFGFPLDKSDETFRRRFGALRHDKIENLPKTARDYALIDVQAHRALRIDQDAKEARSPARPGAYVFADAAAQARAGFVLQLCRWTGVRTDPLLTSNIKQTLRQRQSVIMDRLYELKFVRRPKWLPRAKRWDEPSKDTAVIESKMLAVAREKNIDLKQTPSGGVSMDKEALEMIDDPDLNQISEFNKTQKLLGYTTILEKGFNHPIHSEPNTLVANGRISWGSDSPDGAGDDAKSVNLTNLPKEPGIRECYIPDEDSWIWAVDYGQLELCTFAQSCLWLLGESLMADLINQGVDLHTRLSLMFLESKGIKLTVEQFEELRKTEQVIYNNLTAEDIRNAAKRANFGFLGGMGIDRFMSQNRDLKLLRNDVQALKNAFMFGYPETKPYFALASNISESSNPQIVQLTSGRIRGGLHYCDTANTWFSGLAADGAKEALYQVQRAFFFDRSSPLYNMGAVFAFVHDELVGKMRRQICHEGVDIISKKMEHTMQRRTPDVKIKTSWSLMLRWRKGAKAYTDQNGQRLPFEYSPKFADLVRLGKMVPEPSFYKMAA